MTQPHYHNRLVLGSFFEEFKDLYYSTGHFVDVFNFFGIRSGVALVPIDIISGIILLLGTMVESIYFLYPILNVVSKYLDD